MTREPPQSPDRRRHPRTEVVATAMVFSSNRLHGTFLVQDLSAGGARLVGRVEAAKDDPLTVLLQFPGRAGFSVAARVARHDGRDGEARTAVVFVDLAPEEEDAIHEAIVVALARNAATVLVIDREGPSRDALERDLRSLGHQAVSVTTPLEAISWLDRPDGRIATVLVDVSDGAAQGLEVLDFVGEHHPRIRRVVVGEGFRSDLALRSGRAHRVLRKPWNRDALAETLARAREE